MMRAPTFDVRLEREHVAVMPHAAMSRVSSTLLLVVADGDEVRLIEEDVRRHEDGIGKQAGVDVVRVFSRLILKLRHAGQLPEHGVAV